jgi:hypothetical protein
VVVLKVVSESVSYCCLHALTQMASSHRQSSALHGFGGLVLPRVSPASSLPPNPVLLRRTHDVSCIRIASDIYYVLALTRLLTARPNVSSPSLFLIRRDVNTQRASRFLRKVLNLRGIVQLYSVLWLCLIDLPKQDIHYMLRQISFIIPFTTPLER